MTVKSALLTLLNVPAITSITGTGGVIGETPTTAGTPERFDDFGNTVRIRPTVTVRTRDESVVIDNIGAGGLGVELVCFASTADQCSALSEAVYAVIGPSERTTVGSRSLVWRGMEGPRLDTGFAPPEWSCVIRYRAYGTRGA